MTDQSVLEQIPLRQSGSLYSDTTVFHLQNAREAYTPIRHFNLEQIKWKYQIVRRDEREAGLWGSRKIDRRKLTGDFSPQENSPRKIDRK